ncbi:MAG: lipoprotein [Sutterella sp.]|nr:lipoprotein [Sutterella sp.]
MLRKIILVGLLTSIGLGLAGCGLKGPLYMPPQTSLSAF